MSVRGFNPTRQVDLVSSDEDSAVAPLPAPPENQEDRRVPEARLLDEDEFFERAVQAAAERLWRHEQTPIVRGTPVQDLEPQETQQQQQRQQAEEEAIQLDQRNAHICHRTRYVVGAAILALIVISAAVLTAVFLSIPVDEKLDSHTAASPTEELPTPQPATAFPTQRPPAMDTPTAHPSVRPTWKPATFVDWKQLGAAIDGEAAGDRFGISVAFSADGRTVAVGARNNDGNGSNSGHVRVLSYNNNTNQWEQLGPDIDGEAAGGLFGSSVALSADGGTVAVCGCLFECWKRPTVRPCSRAFVQ